MPLPKPQSALLFNNYFSDGPDASKITGVKGTNDLNIFSVLAGHYYYFSNEKMESPLIPPSYINIDDLKSSNVEAKGVIATPESFKIFPKEAHLAKGLFTKDPSPYVYSLYNQNYSFYFFLPESKTKKIIDDEDKDKYKKFLSCIIPFQDNKIYVEPLGPGTLEILKFQVDQQSLALLDYVFSSKEEKVYKLPVVAKKTFSKHPSDSKTLEIDSLNVFPAQKSDGLTSNDNLDSLKSFIYADKKPYNFYFHNILVNQNDENKPQFNVVSPKSFYKLDRELGFEPKVPQGSNENQIINFYQDSFSKYEKAKINVNVKTFLYEENTYKAPDFETEVLLLSTLLEKTNVYKDFIKPYVSVEFYANSNSDNTNNILNLYNLKLSDKQKLLYLKRFARDKKDLPSEKIGIVKNKELNINELFTSKIEDSLVNMLNDFSKKDLAIPEEISYENKFPAGFLLDDVSKYFDSAYNKISNWKDLVEIKQENKNGVYCSYDVVGYVITKSLNKKIIKRVYILNDAKFTGYVKYFDSQVIENSKYTYKIEQINNIFGGEYAASFDTIDPKKEQIKEFLNFDDNPYLNLSIFLSSSKEEKNLLLAQGENYFPKNSDALNLPIYKNNFSNKSLNVKFKPKNMVVYSPITPISGVEEEIPDIEVNLTNVITKPSTPDIKIYSIKGVSKKAHIFLTNILSKKVEISQAIKKANSKFIDLGANIEEFKFPTKEFRVFRTQEKPVSYEDFSKTPRKVLDPNYADFIDDIEPNTIYYYYADAINTKDEKSDPSKVLKFQIVEEQGHVFPLLEVYDFGEDKEIISEKLFKKIIKISPTFLQSAVGSKGIIGEYVEKDTNSVYKNTLFNNNSTNPTHKIRITSKKTRRRFDINVIFNYLKIDDNEKLPADAVLVLEESYEPITTVFSTPIVGLELAQTIIDLVSPKADTSKKVDVGISENSQPLIPGTPSTLGETKLEDLNPPRQKANPFINSSRTKTTDVVPLSGSGANDFFNGKNEP